MRPTVHTFASAALLMSTSCRPSAAAPHAPASSSEVAAPPRTAAGRPEFTPPATRAGSEGRATYVDSPRYDASNVADLAPGTGSPEAVVVHYLASRVRGDRRYREVMSRACSTDCMESLAEHDTWTFRAFRLLSKTQGSPGRLDIEVWMQIEYKGELDEGEDEFTVVEEAGQFRIAEVPL